MVEFGTYIKENGKWAFHSNWEEGLKQEVKSVEVDKSILDSYTGNYGTPKNANSFKFSNDGEKLIFSTMGRDFPLTAFSNNIFKLDIDEALFIFGRDESGQISYVDIIAHNTSNRAEKIK